MRNLHRMLELFLLFLVGLTSSFAYFVSVWLTDWNRWDRGSYFALAGTAEVSAVVVILFGMCLVSPKRGWAGSTALAGVFFLVTYSRADKEIIKIPTGPFLPCLFFTSTSWTISLMRTLFQPLTSPEAKGSALVGAVGLCLGAALASLADLQKYNDWNPKFFVVYGIPVLTVGTTVAFIPDRYLSF